MEADRVVAFACQDQQGQRGRGEHQLDDHMSGKNCWRPEGRRYENREGYYRDAGAAEATAVLPMASPLTTSSTRRLRWRPSGVSLEATGCVLPKPWAVMEDGATPCSAGKSRTESARRSERC